jgi:hypothetical protein
MRLLPPNAKERKNKMEIKQFLWITLVLVCVQVSFIPAGSILPSVGNTQPTVVEEEKNLLLNALSLLGGASVW